MHRSLAPISSSLFTQVVRSFGYVLHSFLRHDFALVRDIWTCIGSFGRLDGHLALALSGTSFVCRGRSLGYVFHSWEARCFCMSSWLVLSSSDGLGMFYLVVGRLQWSIITAVDALAWDRFALGWYSISLVRYA